MASRSCRMETHAVSRVTGRLIPAITMLAILSP
ncbi:hypothetical protein CLV71_10889 [Actinophytocola oryzae]|uniref:Uncharacterized protein n=1 Tax=Actinophytocola oryzae TaxID=502181 RepID=A0A4R7VI05_9PSEU|nr:hypothetical protein CLV71_10889 [Actinophytocola oryzae]